MTIYIWSLRHSTALGDHWIKEAFCCPDEAQEMIQEFLEAEPHVHFRASEQAPGPVHPVFE